LKTVSTAQTKKPQAVDGSIAAGLSSSPLRQFFNSGAIMHAGQKVRVKPASRIARDWNIPREALGTVICRYRLLKDKTVAPDRLDVRFSPKLVVWGAPDKEFEVVAERS
jgi:hypothetical protein